MRIDPIEEHVSGGLVRTRGGRLVPVEEVAEASAAQEAREEELRQAARRRLSVGFTLAVVVLMGIAAWVFADGDIDPKASVSTRHADFGFVIREIRGPGIER